MKQHPRYLTKSRFKMATECPTKLFYTGKKEYANTQLDDPFLAALADGGHQVGELAKQYYPDGTDITTLDYEEAEIQTAKLLQKQDVVIFEPAIRFNNLFIRIDILVKKGNRIELIEVKAKSYSTTEDRDLLTTKGKVSSTWRPYLLDVAFQKHVLKLAIPEASINSYLLLVDKHARCPTNGLNQKFILEKDHNNRTGVRVSSNLSAKDLSTKLLKKVNVDKQIEVVYNTELKTGMPAQSFKDNIDVLADYYQRDEKVAPVISTKCKTCEFKCLPADIVEGKLSGFKECWQEQLRWTDQDFEEDSVLDVWNFRGAQKCIDNNLIKLVDLSQEDIGVDDNPTPALSVKERQWLQVEKSQRSDQSVYFDSDSMRHEMNTWTYPLHFIDFETSAVAIPFYEGMRPYETVAFQFSHHTVSADGTVTHVGEYLNEIPGKFPNFDFIRALKDQLSKDKGTVFMYSPHENTTLCKIREQLKDSNLPDKQELITFIESITRATQKDKTDWNGERCMVDMLELVKKYYYDPRTKGNNSIKYVLPAMLNRSQYLREKYSHHNYTSHNFILQRWVEFNETGEVVDPYELLPKVLTDISEHDHDVLSEGEALNNGGLALTAYSKLQNTHLSAQEREKIVTALKRYCELDTLAMVFIYEGWREMLKNNG